MITISFYSYKGGVGRSLTMTNLGVYLAQFGATVVMVDFDLEAPGLHYKICPGKPLGINGRGLAGVLADASRGIARNDAWADLIIDVSEHVEAPVASEPELEQPRGRLLLVPAGNPTEPAYWTDLAAIDWEALFVRGSRPGVTALAEMKDHLESTYEPDVLLIDSRTGITPSGGVSTTLLPDTVVMLLLNNPEHLDGSRMVASAIAGSTGAAQGPRVLPVISRYTEPGWDLGPSVSDARGLRGLARRRLAEQAAAASVAPAEEVFAALTRDIRPDLADHIGKPLVLHADAALQRQERLSFGPYARATEDGSEGALLDDYLRLFADLVPAEMVSRYLSGVRSRVRSILLDRPDDAVRTLENLAALVGDEVIFVDLVKVYALRRDSRSMLRAAERLYRVHGRIVVDETISRELRASLLNPGSRNPGDGPFDPEFLEKYWRAAAPTDAEWGARVARALADAGHSDRATSVVSDVLDASPDAEALPYLVRALAAGSPTSERLSVRLALQEFDRGKSSLDFVRAAAEAWRYQRDDELAARIVSVPGMTAKLSDSTAVELLEAVGRTSEAGALLVELLAVADPFEPSTDRLAAVWSSLTARDKELRQVVLDRNPAIVEHLDAVRRGSR